MMTVFYDEAKKKVKTTHFGASGYEDDTTEDELYSETKDDWNDYMRSGSLVYYILWNKLTLTTSIED
jgi:hypothetical protein